MHLNTHKRVGWTCYHHGENPWENVMCLLTSCLHTPVMERSLEQLNTWPVLSSQRRIRFEPRQNPSHLKCQILGRTDRSVKTLSWLWLTLPCGRDWRGLSQEISIHKGSCACQHGTGHRLETQDRFYTTSVTLVFKAVCTIMSETGCFLSVCNRFLPSISKFFTLFDWTTRNCNHKASWTCSCIIFKFLISLMIWLYRLI